jgi:hypothetical protein
MPMTIAITLELPEDLVKEATSLGIFSSQHIELLIRADIQAQLIAMAQDADIQRELSEIETAFLVTEADGLDNYGA